MEFASEMVINASRAGLRIAEVPVTYSPRPEGSESKLRSFHDGWRHLRFMLLYSPNWLFMIPGLTLLGLGFLLLLALVGGPLDVAGLHFDLHYMVLGALLALIGYQVLTLGIYAKVYAVSEHFEENSHTITLLTRYFDLERGILVGSLVFLVGLVINLYIVYIWVTQGFGERTWLREGILAMTLMVIGLQTVFSSFSQQKRLRQYNYN